MTTITTTKVQQSRWITQCDRPDVNGPFSRNDTSSEQSDYYDNRTQRLYINGDISAVSNISTINVGDNNNIHHNLPSQHSVEQQQDKKKKSSFEMTITPTPTCGNTIALLPVEVTFVVWKEFVSDSFDETWCGVSTLDLPFSVSLPTVVVSVNKSSVQHSGEVTQPPSVIMQQQPKIIAPFVSRDSREQPESFVRELCKQLWESFSWYTVPISSSIEPSKKLNNYTRTIRIDQLHIITRNMSKEDSDRLVFSLHWVLSSSYPNFCKTLSVDRIVALQAE